MPSPRPANARPETHAVSAQLRYVRDTEPGIRRRRRARALADAASADAKPVRRTFVRVVNTVARLMGNTPAVCRKCYIHPFVIEAYEDGALAGAQGRGSKPAHAPRGLRQEEAALLALLRRKPRPRTRGR
jgi:DNA topoisomerase IB